MKSSKVHIGTCPGDVGRCGTPLTPTNEADPGRGTLGPGAVYVAPGMLCARCRRSYEKEGGRVYEGEYPGDLIAALHAELDRAIQKRQEYFEALRESELALRDAVRERDRLARILNAPAPNEPPELDCFGRTVRT
jgi:hypothetical protein